MFNSKNSPRRKITFRNSTPPTPELQFLSKVQQFFESPGSPYLQKIRLQNKMRRFVSWFGVSTILNATIGAIISTALATDRLEQSPIQDFLLRNIDSNVSAFLYFTIELPAVIILSLYSFLFYSTHRKYVTVFRPEFLRENGGHFLRNWAGLCVYGPQVAGILMVIAPISFLPRYFPFVLGAVTFVIAGSFARNFAIVVEDRVKDLAVSISKSSSEMRRFRANHISEMSIFSQISSGWMSLNLIWAVVLLTLAVVQFALAELFNDFRHGETALGPATSVVRIGVWFFLFLILLTSLVGAMRQYGKFADRRYFNAAEIVNKEFSTLNGDDEGYAQDADAKLNSMKFYSLEHEPTVPPSESASSLVAAAFSTTRLWQSAAFSAIVYLLSYDAILSVLTFLALCFSYAFNDLIDYLTGKDAICHPNRPLPKGDMNAAQATFLSASLLALFSAFWMIAGAEAWESTVYLIIGGILYTSVLKYRAPLVATPFWCALIAMIFQQAMGISLIATAGIWLVILGREVILDFRDAEADLQVLRRRNIGGIFGSNTPLFSMALYLSAGALLALEVGVLAGIFAATAGIVLNLVFLFEIRRFGLHVGARRFAALSHIAWPLALLVV